ncbi:MAG: hypothetical protein KH324_01880 [Ruminococcus sp.]|jgi:hypothetical protein|nr:hypothetical protein [Ruminococcus sp.]
MIGDDVCSTFVALLKSILDIVSSIEKEKNRANAAKKPNVPKIKVGKLSKQHFEKLQKAGAEFKYITVPAEKLSEIEKTVRKMGGSYFNAQVGDNNNAVLAVPASQLDLLNMAMKHVVANELAENSDKIIVKDGKDLIDSEDIGLVSRIMNKYDIPVITFKTEDDKYMNVVPKEYEGQYSKALSEAEQVKKEVGNIEVTRYEQTAPLDALGFEAYTVLEDEARELFAAAKADDLDISFVPFGDKIAVKYSTDISEQIGRAREEYKASLQECENYLVEVYDYVITLDMQKLNIEELNTSDSYFMRVPNTSGQDYIRISKAESKMINGGKTLKSELDFDKKYPVYDVNGKVKRTVSGSELTGYFNTRNRHINKDTAVYKYGTDGGELRRIDLFNAKKNELISVKMGSAEEMRTALKERGLNGKTVNKLIEDINNKLTDKQKETFAYTAEKSEIVYADIPNIGEYLAQSQLSQKVIGRAECIGEIPKDNGAKCCILDNNTNKFAVIPVMPAKEVQAMLSQMGYSEVSAKEIADKVTASYRENDIGYGEQFIKMLPVTGDLKRYDASNAELRDMGYCNNKDSTIIIRDDAENYRYMQVERNTPLADAEKAFREDFGLVDDISVACAMKQLIADNIVNDAHTYEHSEASIKQLSGNMAEITAKESGKSEIMAIGNINAEKLAELGISEKGAADISRSFEKSIRDSKFPDRQTLGGLKQFAQEKFKELSQTVKDKIISKGKGGQEL